MGIGVAIGCCNPMSLYSEAMTAVQSPLRVEGAPARSVPGLAVVGLFTLAVFTGSSLLFVVQPMFARLVLPHLGGSPSVWNTCMLFFQGLLLLGYLYAHVSTKVLPVRRHVIAHLALLCAPLAVLPIAVAPPDGSLGASPTTWLLMAATVAVGLPFFVVSTSAPLLQRWFAALRHPAAKDPYFLYGASNLGSMVALLSYPFGFEPLVGLAAQSRIWAWGYGLFALLTAGCAVSVRLFASNDSPAAAQPLASSPLTWGDRLFWLLMAFVPSTLMLGVTTHISTDIAAFPLLWIVPLAMYLFTFVIAFSFGKTLRSTRLAAPVALLGFGTLVSLLRHAHLDWLIPLHLVTFAAAALLCHLRLAETRPGVSRLTEFYIWLSLGGLLGGAFNSIIAPSVFSTVLEYPLALAAAILIAAASRKPGPPAPISLRYGLLAAAGLMVVFSAAPSESPTQNQATLIACAVVAVLTILERRNLGVMPRLVVLVAIMGVVFAGRPPFDGVVLHTERSFFGVHRILEGHDGSKRLLFHGSTLHGWQALPAVGCEPSSYYSRKGPIGEVFAEAAGRFERVAVVGLGTGGLACYAGSGDSWTFYEIDRIVERLATNPAYFNHMSNSAGNLEVVVADGRLGLQRAPAGSYDLIILDAFSSDSIPVHLLTREAMELYFSKLASGGMVAVHISNRYLQLEPALAALSRDLGLQGFVRGHRSISPEDLREGRASSRWVVLTRDRADLLGLTRDWRQLDGTLGVRVWTDDYSNVLEALLLNYGLR